MNACCDLLAPVPAARCVAPLWLGIDPGMTGAASLIDDRLLECEDLPTCSNGAKAKAHVQRWLDAGALDTMLRDWSARHDFAGRGVTVILEKPIPMPRLPATTIASQFDTFGVIRGLIGARRSWRLLTPGPEWKRMYGLRGGEKNKHESRAVAARMYPNAPVSRAKDDDRAEAILIAHWARSRHA
jgi:crossover junction endodeoxyribonuclease RuvC